MWDVTSKFPWNIDPRPSASRISDGSPPETTAAATYYDTLLRKDANLTLRDSLCHPMKPVFIFGATPPREGTDEAKQLESCEKFVARARVLPVDGYVIYDIQDEAGRTNDERPFPFRRTVEPAQYASRLAQVTNSTLRTRRPVSHPAV